MTEATRTSETPFADELERLLPDMRAFARSLCRDVARADDLVQETCLKAWAARDRFTPGAPMRPWLFRILRNIYLQAGRRAWRDVPLAPEEAEFALVAPESLAHRSDFKVLQQAMSRLPLAQREALIVVLAAGFTYEEAGALLGCSDGTVKSRVNRGREALLHLMDDADKGRLRINREAEPEANEVESLIASMMAARERMKAA